MRGQAIDHIFDLIENLEREIALLKILVQQAISDEDEVGQDILVDDVAYLSSGTAQEDSVLVDAEIVEEDAKPRAKTSKKEQLLEARRRSKEWANTERERKRAHQSNYTARNQGD
jgi:hypothetical protein